jgi:hypothetical protein
VIFESVCSSMNDLRITKDERRRMNHSWITESESDLYYDRRSVGQSVLVSSPLLGLMTRFLLLSDIAGFLYGAPGLTRGRVCLLQCTMYNIQHILLSQIWDQIPVFISPRNRVVRLYPQALGPFASLTNQLRVDHLELRGEPNRDHHLQLFCYSGLIRCCGNVC